LEVKKNEKFVLQGLEVVL
jgi:hypothetical protein